MTRAYVLDPTTRAVLGLVDQSWQKLSYTRRYYGMDTFLMTINRSRLWASELQKGRLLYLPDEGDRLFLIEQIQSTAEGSVANDNMVVAGRSLEGIAMAERLVEPGAGLSHDEQVAVKAETAMKYYVKKHAGVDAIAARQVPALLTGADLVRGITVTTAGRYQTVFDMVKEIGLLAGMGWEITYEPIGDDYVFEVLVGTDRSASVFFDFAFETLEKWDEIDSLIDSKTVAVVAGQGEGAAREIQKRWSGAEPTGFARREAFLDARDIDAGDTVILQARGDSFLAASKGEKRLEAGIHQYGSFRYDEHWFLGDLVLIRNEERGISYSARIVEVEKAFDVSASSPTVTTVIDRPFPTMKEQIQGASAGAGMVDSPNTLNPAVDTITFSRLNQDIVLSRLAAGSLLMAVTGDAVLNIRGTARSQLHFRSTADTFERLQIRGDSLETGIMMGSGSAAMDVRLYRAGADIWRTDDAFRSQRPLATDEAFGAQVTGNIVMPFVVLADGQLEWGSGTGARDVNLYRPSANVLETDDALRVGGSLSVGGAGAGQTVDGLNISGGNIEMRNLNPFIDFKTSDIDFGARIIYDFTVADALEFTGAAVYIFDNDLSVGGRTMSGDAPIRRVYTAGATWTKPAGLSHVEVECVGGGGGGGGTPATGASDAAMGGCGGGGGYSRKLLLAAALASTVAVTVGAGGTAGAAGANAGGTGGTSSFAAHSTATGGTGGGAGTATSTTGAPTSGVGGGGTGDFVASGMDGVRPRISGGTISGVGSGGNSGGGMGGGGPQGVTGVGSAGGLYGAGGAGATAVASTAARAGGAGGAGIVIVTEYYFS